MRTLGELEAAWNAENERFQKFQRLANRDMQLARACLGEKEKTDFEILAKIENRKLVSKPIGDHILLTNEELAQLSSEVENLSKSLELLEEKEDQLKIDELENSELKSENELLKQQIDFVTSKINQIDLDTETFRSVKMYSLAKIDNFHTINTQWQEDELTGVHITLNSLQSKNEDSLASIEPTSIERTTSLNSLKRSNHLMRTRKKKTRKNLDSYPEWVERIQQERFNNEVDCLLLQAEIDSIEKNYKTEFEENFHKSERLSTKISNAKSGLYETEILNSELEKEEAFRKKRAEELEMLERALQQQDADFEREISRLKRQIRD